MSNWKQCAEFRGPPVPSDVVKLFREVLGVEITGLITLTDGAFKVSSPGMTFIYAPVEIAVDGEDDHDHGQTAGAE